jgi:hypothetical protein
VLAAKKVPKSAATTSATTSATESATATTSFEKTSNDQKLSFQNIACRLKGLFCRQTSLLLSVGDMAHGLLWSCYSSSIKTTSAMASNSSKRSKEIWQPSQVWTQCWSQLKLFNSETTLHGPAHVTADNQHPIERYFS